MEPVAGVDPKAGPESHRDAPRARLSAAVEVVLASAVIVLDVGIPSLVLLVLAGASMILRRRGPRPWVCVALDVDAWSSRRQSSPWCGRCSSWR